MVSYSVLIPAYNEAQTIESVLSKVVPLPGEKEIIVVDDGSSDGTSERVRAFGRFHPEIQFVSHPINQGKGKAIATGLRTVRNEVVVIQDADLEYDPGQIPQLLQPFNDPEVQIVFGSRFLQENPNIYRRYLWGNKLITAWINWLTGGRLTDAYTGYKLFRKEVLEEMKVRSRGFEIEAELAVKVAVRRCGFLEMPIHYQPRSLEEGKKIGFEDALKGFWTASVIRWLEFKHGQNIART